MKLDAKLNLNDLQDSKNINSLLSDDDSSNIGNWVKQNYDADKSSRSMWEKKTNEAMKLALQVKETKTYPWPEAANVKFPLITIASQQFAARAYPALVKAPDLVKFRKQGDDDGAKASRAHRISRHMSWQLLEEDEGWEEDHDKMLLVLPIVGCAFKKSYYDPAKGHNCSKLVLPRDLVVHYYAKSIEGAERATEVYQLSPRKVKEKQLKGIFSDVELGPVSVNDEDSNDPEVDERQGTKAPFSGSDDQVPRTILEQHTYLDLDGDGYPEPYVITIDKATANVLRIVARFKNVKTQQSVAIEEIQLRMRKFAEGLPNPQNGQQLTPEEQTLLIRGEATVMKMREQVEALALDAEKRPKVLEIEPIQYFTKYSFIPSPDGGFYDLGFGVLIGPLNNSVNTLINQLLDSGALQNGSVGFIGKGARIKGGKVRFSPNEWKRVPVAGGTLRDSLVPLPINQPSAVLFNLLSLLISYAERVGSVTDTMTGENPGQNTPAYNMSAMLEQGLQIFNGIFKRVYRGMRGEFRKLYALNAVYLDERQYFEYQDSEDQALRVDYTADPKDLIPAADPNAFSNREKAEKAVLIAERAGIVPGYDQIEVEMRFLDAMDVPDAAQLFPVRQDEQGNRQLAFPPQPDPELEIKKADMERRTIEGKVRGEVDVAKAEVLMMEAEANVLLKMAQAQKEVDEPTVKRLQLMLDEMKDKRKTMVDMAKIEAQKESARAAKANASKQGASS